MGATVVAIPDGGRNIRSIKNNIAAHKATILSATPTVIRELNKDVESIKLLRNVISGGEKLFPSDISNIINIAQVYNTYGPTETTICATYNHIDETGNASMIGSPVEHSSVFILDQNFNLLPMNVCGEIFIGGSGVARGYLNNPELTASKFLVNPFDLSSRLYRTGDLGRWLADGTIEYLGRKDDQVKIRGYRIELGEIESVIQTYPGVGHSVVVVREDEIGNKRLIAYVVCKGIKEEIRNHVKSRLPDYMVPAHWIEVDSLPMTPNGKIDKKSLHDPDLT